MWELQTLDLALTGIVVKQSYTKGELWILHKRALANK